MKLIGLVCTILMGALCLNTANAQVNIGDEAKISGTVFSDYYYVAQNHNEDFEGENGFWFRRVRFTYDRTINDNFSARLRLDMSSDGSFGDAASKMTPSVKDAYLKWKKGNHSISVGITPPPIWREVEGAWGYRSLEKSPLDRYGMGSSRDFGISFTGKLGEAEKLDYHFMVGNGNSNRANEINKGKKFSLSLGYPVTENIYLEVYGDYDDREGDTDRSVLQGFGSYSTESLTLGVVYAVQNRENARTVLTGTEDLSVSLGSVFANFAISDNVIGILRLDHAFDGVPGTDDDDYLPISSATSSTLFIGGLDFEVGPGINLMPNVEAVFYGEDDNGFSPDTDLIPRLTLAYDF